LLVNRKYLRHPNGRSGSQSAQAFSFAPEHFGRTRRTFNKDFRTVSKSRDASVCDTPTTDAHQVNGCAATEFIKN
jgi:hypothetical protein